MKNVNNDASGKQVCVWCSLCKDFCLFLTLRAITSSRVFPQKSRSSIVTSVSPSPFAPPPASSSIAETVSQPLPLPSSSSSSSPHLAVRAKSPDVVQVHPDQLAHSSGSAGIEHVKEHSSASVSRPDAGEAEPRGNSATDHLDAFTHDPPDQPQPRALSRQVCLSSRAVLLSACVYAYVSCDRVQCCHPWILPITPHRHAPPHDIRQRPLCSFLPRRRVPHPLAPCPTLFLQKNAMSYPSIRPRPRPHHHCRRRPVDFVAVTHESRPRPTNKDGN